MDENNQETKIVEAYKLFFVESKDKRSYSFRGRIINLELGVPKDCVELYKIGLAFPYLKLKQGADVLFKANSEEEILNLIMIKSETDIKILNKLITSKDGKALVAQRLKELKSPL